ncbi:hypothetical protein [Thermococcus sp.]
MKRTLFLIMLLIFITILNSFVISFVIAGELSQKVTSNISAEVDPRVELVEIIFTLQIGERCKVFLLDMNRDTYSIIASIMGNGKR